MSTVSEVGLEPIQDISIYEEKEEPGYGSLGFIHSIFEGIKYWENPISGKWEFWWISKERELEIGEEHYSEIRKQAIPDHPDLNLCKTILDDLVVFSKRKFPFEICITKEDSGIAGSMYAGGKIVISAKFLKELDQKIQQNNTILIPDSLNITYSQKVRKEDVIAALIGHEIIHSDARHIMQGAEISSLFFVAYTIICLCTPILGFFYWNFRAGLLCALVFEIWAFNISTLETVFRYKSRELEADKYGVLNAIKAGYNPLGAIVLMDILEDMLAKDNLELSPLYPSFDQRKECL